MKQIVLAMFLFQVSIIYSEFTLETIENRSDLKFQHAYHKNLGKEKKLLSLTDALQKSHGKQHVVIDKTVGTDGLALVMSDNQGHQATIFIHDQARQSIEYKRKKAKQIAQFPEIIPAGSGPYSAQVMMQDAADSKMLTEPKAYNHQEGIKFNLAISGSQGSYQVSLHPAV